MAKGVHMLHGRVECQYGENEAKRTALQGNDHTVPYALVAVCVPLRCAGNGRGTSATTISSSL